MVDAAEGIIEHRAVLPVRAVVAGLPDIFDPVRVFSQQEGLEISFDSGLHQIGTLGKRATAIAIQTILIGRNFDDRKTRTGRLACDDCDVLDLWGGHSAGRAFYLLLGLGKRCS